MPTIKNSELRIHKREEKMAAIETNTKMSLHIRSNSLPSAPHPIQSQCEDHLQRLKDSETTPSTSSSSSSLVSRKLNGLLDLHDCTDKLLQLPTKQQALARECGDKCADDLLEGSLRILDICNTAKDCILASKESLHELQSVVRRRRGDETTGFTVEAAKYLASRKSMKKATRKALGNVKAMKRREDDETLCMLRILKESEEVTVRSLESLLEFISDSKRSRWCAISKLMVQQKRVASCDSDANEFEKVDATLKSLISHKTTSSSIENLQYCGMQDLEMCIQDLETVVDQLIRKLIRNRVSLLNIFNH